MSDRPGRVLVVLPSWVGDAVMATPALRVLRDALPGGLIGGLARPGIGGLLDGTGLIDQWHTNPGSGVMGPKRAAQRVRAGRYEAAVLLTNSFSTALAMRLAFVPERVGYDRDGRGMLLTRRLAPPRRGDGKWAMVPAVDYYRFAVQSFVRAWTGVEPDPIPAGEATRADVMPMALPAGARLELAVTERDRVDAERTLAGAGVGAGAPIAVLNPGGNNEAKRWAADRFAAVGEHLRDRHGCRVLVNGSPGEGDLCAQIADACGGVSLAAHGGTLTGLKAILARARVLVTNDTGPRHIAAALGTRCVALFGATDPRWTTIPAPGERLVLADPDLPAGLSANDHPERCAVGRISVDRVLEAVDGVLSDPGGGFAGGAAGGEA